MSGPDLLNITRPPAWMADGLCAQTDPELWFPETGGSTAEAKAVCSRCPVRPECLAFALEHRERFGVWGGASERERRRMTRSAGRRAAPVRVLDRRASVVWQLATRLTDSEIAARLGCCARTVLRIRTAAGIPPARPSARCGVRRADRRVGAA